MTQLLVPDASVILKWVLPSANEPLAEEARGLLEDFVSGEVDVLLPSLWYFEVANTLARQFPEDALAILGVLRELGLPLASPCADWEQEAVDLVRRFGVTFYDAAYHGLALAQGGLFVTGDDRYRERVSGAGAAVGLADYPWR